MKGLTEKEAVAAFEAAVAQGPHALAAFMAQLTAEPPKTKFYACYRNNGMLPLRRQSEWTATPNRRARRANGLVRTGWFEPRIGPRHTSRMPVTS